VTQVICKYGAQVETAQRCLFFYWEGVYY